MIWWAVIIYGAVIGAFALIKVFIDALALVRKASKKRGK